MDKFWLRIIYIFSIVITLAITFLILGPRPDGIEGMVDVSMLPLVNALLNSASTLLLIVALWLIKKKNIPAELQKFGYQDIRNWSNMEAKFELASLLAHPKSAITNIKVVFLNEFS